MIEEKLTQSMYQRFYAVVLVVLVTFLSLLAWSFTVGEGENNLGGWLYVGFVSGIFITALLMGFGLTLRALLAQFLKGKFEHPALISAVAAGLVTLGFVIIRSPLKLEGLLVLFTAVPAGLVSFIAYLLRVEQPNAWRTNVAPALLGIVLVVIGAPFVAGGFNYVARNAGICSLVIDERPRINCYRSLAFRTRNVQLCREHRLDRMVSGDCIMTVAALTRDVDLCDVPELRLSGRDTCLYEVALAARDVTLCGRIENERYKRLCAETIEYVMTAKSSFEDKKLSWFKKLINFFEGEY